MDPSSPFTAADIYQLAAIVGGVGVTGALGLLFVRRARAARRRQIDSVGEAPEPLARPKKDKSSPSAGKPEDAEAPSEVPRRGSSQAAGTAPARATEPRPDAPRKLPEPTTTKVAPESKSEGKSEGKSAQVIPFPVPSAPVPVPAPGRIEPAPRARDASALAPGLARTRSTGFIARLGQILSGRKELDPSIVDEIEKVLLTADIGVKTSQKLLEEIRGSLTRRELKDPDAVWAFLRQRSAEMLAIPAPEVDFSSARPFVLLVVGVNGSGKTTTIGKLAAKLGAEGKRVLLAAGDTFRAAAAEQLEIWSQRSQATLVRGKEGADPSSVIFDGVKRAATEGFDVAIADTAGRLHTKTDLMQELQKIRRVIGKASAGAPHETWLVIDATSGQNAIAQAQIFTGDMSVTGIVLTKLDGTAKGGVILGIADQLKIPVRYVGVGERVEDLRRFDPEEFVEALFAPPGN
jgi:fused signal recognition particle receptor